MAMGQMQKTIKLDVKVAEELWPYKVINELQKTMEEGLKKHPDGDGWDESVDTLVDRAYGHLVAFRGGYSAVAGKSEDHLAHAFSDLMMAMAITRGYGLSEFATMAAESDRKDNE